MNYIMGSILGEGKVIERHVICITILGILWAFSFTYSHILVSDCFLLLSVTWQQPHNTTRGQGGATLPNMKLAKP